MQCYLWRSSEYNNVWSAPEVAETGQPSLSGDIYSLGVVFFELFAGVLPMTNRVTQRIDLPCSSFPLRDLILPCVDENPMKRPQIEDILFSYDTYSALGLNDILKKIMTGIRSKLVKTDSLPKSTKWDDDDEINGLYLLLSKQENGQLLKNLIKDESELLRYLY